jgi:hypothetical protein
MGIASCGNATDGGSAGNFSCLARREIHQLLGLWAEADLDAQ